MVNLEGTTKHQPQRITKESAAGSRLGSPLPRPFEMAAEARGAGWESPFTSSPGPLQLPRTSLPFPVWISTQWLDAVFCQMGSSFPLLSLPLSFAWYLVRHLVPSINVFKK